MLVFHRERLLIPDKDPSLSSAMLAKISCYRRIFDTSDKIAEIFSKVYFDNCFDRRYSGHLEASRQNVIFDLRRRFAGRLYLRIWVRMS